MTDTALFAQCNLLSVGHGTRDHLLQPAPAACDGADQALMEIDRILSDCIRDPVGPEFMAPPTRFAA
jgi:hypothetical protein